MEGSAGRRCGRAGFGYKNGSIPTSPCRNYPVQYRSIKVRPTTEDRVRAILAELCVAALLGG